ncbi:MAG: fibrobacter succinogenes major paralogous domain-containing protein [Saprospiraceae bacterium]|nr:fibrobacter succinogenes major paralogous domain-containing protein [Saprospiraceae bacterium]
MKLHQLKNIIALVIIFSFKAGIVAQTISLFVEGGLKIGNLADSLAVPGSLRWNEPNVEGYTGLYWLKLNGSKLSFRGGVDYGNGLISEIDGGIQLNAYNGPSFSTASPVYPRGTIRWSGRDFLGWNGVFWASLTGRPLYDVDSYTYQTDTIGSQIWMKENLKTAKFRNGDPIPEVDSGSSWAALTTGAFCWYENDGDSEYAYGKLYNWYAVNDSRKLCPVGWHIPTEADWNALITFLGGVNLAGGKMKETGLQLWDDPNTGATNESGFSGLAGGLRNFSGNFVFMGGSGSWWGTPAGNFGDAYTQSLNTNTTSAVNYYEDRRSGASVRCIKDP